MLTIRHPVWKIYIAATTLKSRAISSQPRKTKQFATAKYSSCRNNHFSVVCFWTRIRSNRRRSSHPCSHGIILVVIGVRKGQVEFIVSNHVGVRFVNVRFLFQPDRQTLT